MRYPHETDSEFRTRVEQAAAKGICVFADDADREFIFDIIGEYMDIRNAVLDQQNNRRN